MNRSIVRLLALSVLAVLTPCRLPAQQGAGSQPPESSPEATSPAPAQTPVAQPDQPPAQPNQTPKGTQATQDSNGTYTIHRTARLVVLDMVVTDAKGNVVRDLKQDDFHVTEAGAPQTILNFEEAGAHTPDPNIEINSTADLDRLAPRAPVNIILLDEFNTRFEDMAFARYSLKKYLEKQPDKLTTPTMLIAVSLEHFTVLHDYTQNKNEIIAALDHHFVQYPWQAHQGAWLAERFGTAFITLRRVAQAVVGHPGHKNMIWIGRGFPAINFTNAAVDAQERVDNAVQECVNVLRDARVTLYTIDPAGLMVDPGVYGMAAAFNDPFGGNYQFARLATATGGRTLYGRNDVDAQIGTAIRDGASLYTLTYRPTNASLDARKFRRIEVSLDRPGLTVTTRKGYYLERGPGQVNPQNPSRRLMADLISADSSTMVYDGVPLTLETSATDPDAFTLHIGGRGLFWTPATDTEPRHTQVILVVSTFDRKGKELKNVAKQLTVPVTTGVPPTGRLDRGLDINYKIDHDPKAVRARFVIRAAGSGRIGTADAVLGQPLPVKPPAPASPQTP